MNFNKYILASLIMLSTSPLFADIEVPYGEGSGKVDYFNTNRFSALEDPLPYGPMAFRLVEDKTWLADSVGGKLMQFDSKGKLISEFSILQNGTKPYEIDEEGLPIPNIVIEDFAPVKGQYGDVEAWWVIDSQENKAFKFAPDGKILAMLEDEDFGQLFRVEAGVGGHLFIADKGSKKIYVYNSEGEQLSEQEWEWSGMAVCGKEDKLYRLMYFNEDKKHLLVCTDVNGKVINSQPIDIIDMDNPELWWVDEAKGEAVITYNPEGGFKGTYNIVRVGLNGKVIATGQLLSPFYMNRFIDHLDYTDVFIGKCNLSEAPNGKVEIVPFKMPE